MNYIVIVIVLFLLYHFFYGQKKKEESGGSSVLSEDDGDKATHVTAKNDQFSYVDDRLEEYAACDGWRFDVRKDVPVSELFAEKSRPVSDETIPEQEKEKLSMGIYDEEPVNVGALYSERPSPQKDGSSCGYVYPYVIGQYGVPLCAVMIADSESKPEGYEEAKRIAEEAGAVVIEREEELEDTLYSLDSMVTEESYRKWIATILAEEFSEYELETDVPVTELTGNVEHDMKLYDTIPKKAYKAEWGCPYDFVLKKDGRWCVAIVASESMYYRRRVKYLISRRYAVLCGVPFVTFYMDKRNRREYVKKRIEDSLMERGSAVK